MASSRNLGGTRVLGGLMRYALIDQDPNAARGGGKPSTWLLCTTLFPIVACYRIFVGRPDEDLIIVIM